MLGTERHESRRIDNQLRGRSGRQGDPGESRFYLSLEDDLMRHGNAIVSLPSKNEQHEIGIALDRLDSLITLHQGKYVRTITDGTGNHFPILLPTIDA